jgi:lysophospholipid acyltransferase (LPLAT)-like uncharacterized protein
MRTLANLGRRFLAQRLVDVFLILENTLDVRVYGLERLREAQREGRVPLLVIWHGQGLQAMATFREETLCLYASHTREETYARSLQILRLWTLRFVESLGYKVLDAAQFKSESRGVMQFVELLRGGMGSVIAADGPAGPIYEAKPGPAFLSKKAGVVLIPVGSAISGGFQLEQWDKFEVPWPFARSVVMLGELIQVDPKADDAEIERARRELETSLNALMEEAQKRLRPHRSEPMQQMQAQRAE